MLSIVYIIVANDTIISEYGIGKDTDGRGHALIKGNTLAFAIQWSG
jgi:hypothetical protein